MAHVEDLLPADLDQVVVGLAPTLPGNTVQGDLVPKKERKKERKKCRGISDSTDSISIGGGILPKQPIILISGHKTGRPWVNIFCHTPFLFQKQKFVVGQLLITAFVLGPIQI